MSSRLSRQKKAKGIDFIKASDEEIAEEVGIAEA